MTIARAMTQGGVTETRAVVVVVAAAAAAVAVAKIEIESESEIASETTRAITTSKRANVTVIVIENVRKSVNESESETVSETVNETVDPRTRPIAARPRTAAMPATPAAAVVAALVTVAKSCLLRPPPLPPLPLADNRAGTEEMMTAATLLHPRPPHLRMPLRDRRRLRHLSVKRKTADATNREREREREREIGCCRANRVCTCSAKTTIQPLLSSGDSCTRIAINTIPPPKDIYLFSVRKKYIKPVLCVVSLEEVELTNNRPEQFTIIYLFIDRLNKSGV